MMHFTKERLAQFDDVDGLLDSCLMPEQRTRNEAEARAAVWDDAGIRARRMTELGRSFPGMRPRFDEGAEKNGLEPWNFLALVEASRSSSPGQQLIVSFLAEVWNSKAAADYVVPFRLVDANERLDPDDWAAVAQWVAEPFWY